MPFGLLIIRIFTFINREIYRFFPIFPLFRHTNMAENGVKGHFCGGRGEASLSVRSIKSLAGNAERRERVDGKAVVPYTHSRWCADMKIIPLKQGNRGGLGSPQSSSR